jgi:hypothetical protein
MNEVGACTLTLVTSYHTGGIMSVDRDLDCAVHRHLFEQADTASPPWYSTTVSGYQLVDKRLAILGWRIASTEQDRCLTTVTLQHQDGCRVFGLGIDEYEATCRAALTAEFLFAAAN